MNDQELSQDYPRTKFHPEHGIRIANTPEAEEALGEGWYDTPADFPVVGEEPAEDGQGCVQCRQLSEQLKDQTDKFDTAWRRLSEQYDAAVQELAALKAKAAKAAAAKATTAKATTTVTDKAPETQPASDPDTAPKIQPAE